jgi:hypothetical protein
MGNMREQNPLLILEKYVLKAGNQKKAAAELGISAQYLCDLLAGRREPSDQMLEKLGLRRAIVKA